MGAILMPACSQLQGPESLATFAEVARRTKGMPLPYTMPIHSLQSA